MKTPNIQDHNKKTTKHLLTQIPEQLLKPQLIPDCPSWWMCKSLHFVSPCPQIPVCPHVTTRRLKNTAGYCYKNCNKVFGIEIFESNLSPPAVLKRWHELLELGSQCLHIHAFGYNFWVTVSIFLENLKTQSSSPVETKQIHLTKKRYLSSPIVLDLGSWGHHKQK